MMGKYNFRAGLRFERTVFKLFSNDSALNVPRYTNWLPNLLLSRNFAGQHTLTVSFSSRLQRPFIVWLNPVVYYIDSLNIEQGNPNLQAVRIRNYNLSYTARLKNITLNAAMLVIYSKGNIEPVQKLLPGGVAEKTWINISSNTAYGLSAGLNYQDAHWSVNLNRISFQEGDGITSRSAWLLQNSAVINYTFAKSWTLASYLTLNTNTPILQGTVTGTRWYNLLLIKKFKGDQLSAAMRFDNFFTPYQYVTEEINTPIFTQTREPEISIVFLGSTFHGK